MIFVRMSPIQTKTRQTFFSETNVETSEADSAEFLSCDEGFDDVFVDVFRILQKKICF